MADHTRLWELFEGYEFIVPDHERSFFDLIISETRKKIEERQATIEDRIANITDGDTIRGFPVDKDAIRYFVIADIIYHEFMERGDEYLSAEALDSVEEHIDVYLNLMSTAQQIIQIWMKGIKTQHSQAVIDRKLRMYSRALNYLTGSDGRDEFDHIMDLVSQVGEDETHYGHVDGHLNIFERMKKFRDETLKVFTDYLSKEDLGKRIVDTYVDAAT